VVNAQEKGAPITVHVKEVHREQEEGTEKGTWFHITVIAESKTIAFSLKCDEFFDNKTHGFVIQCFDLSAGKDYSARKFPTAMSFWPDGTKSGQGRMMAAYDIVSEKEK
ncbi:MAG: hypothetical protein WBE13_19345, partial [Candidatus Acidiferrum sp.]